MQDDERGEQSSDDVFLWLEEGDIPKHVYREQALTIGEKTKGEGNMAVEVNHTPFFVTFTGSSEELAPLTELFREEAIVCEKSDAGKIAIDLRAQGAGPASLLKGALVWELVDLYTPTGCATS